MKKELCIDSLDGAMIAHKYGFDSVEVNTALQLGGLTPPLGLVRNIIKKTNLKVNVMIRNRPGGFVYDHNEYLTLLDELDIYLNEKIDGIVFGFLTKDFEIDKAKTREFVEKIHGSGKIAIFHRAFDNTNDFEKSLEELITLGVDRILTSGHKKTAIEGLPILNKLIEKSHGRIEIIAGGGINSSNLEQFKDSKVDYIHTSAKGYREDISAFHNADFRIDGTLNYQISDEEEIKKILGVLNGLEK